MISTNRGRDAKNAGDAGPLDSNSEIAAYLERTARFDRRAWHDSKRMRKSIKRRERRRDQVISDWDDDEFDEES